MTADLSAARPPRWSLRQTLAALAALLVFTLAALLIWHLRDAVVPWDSKNQFYPMFRFLAGSLAQGELPLWNPYHFSGHPTVADPQSGLFTPTIFLFAWLCPGASMQTYDSFIMAHLFAGGVGVLALFRRRGWGAPGAALAAIIFMLGGPAAARLQHTGMIISYASFPLALWALEAALEKNSFIAAAAFGVAASLMALGRDQVAFISCGLFLCVLVWECVRTPQPLRWLASRLGVLALAGVIGIAIITVPALLTLQFLHGSNRPAFPFGVAATGSLSPLNFATLFAPNVFGSLNLDYSYYGPSYATSALPDWTDRNINYLFIGALPACLIIWHGVAGGRLAATPLRAVAALGAAALLYALGNHTPVFALIYDALPGIALYRRPADATFPLNFASAVAAGYLLHRYVANGLPHPAARLGKGLTLALRLGTVLGLATLIAAALMFAAARQHLAQATEAIGVAAFIAAGGAAWLIAGQRMARRGLFAVVFAAAGAGEILWFNAASGLNAEPASRYSVYGELRPDEAAALAALRAEIARRHDEGARPRVEILGLPGPWMNASMALQLEDTLGYNPLRIVDYERAVGVGENAGDPNLRHFPGVFRSYQGKLASLLGLEYLVLDRPISELPRHVPRPTHASLIFSTKHIYIYKLGPAAPRASFASRVSVAETQALLEGQDWPPFDRAQEALVDVMSLQKLSADYGAHDGVPDPPEANSDVTIAAWHNNRVVLEVNTDRPGVVVLNDLFYPGWEVMVDGARNPILRVNLLFRGVEVSAGHHVVEFDFRPFSWENLRAAAGSLVHGPEASRK